MVFLTGHEGALLCPFIFMLSDFNISFCVTSAHRGLTI